MGKIRKNYLNESLSISIQGDFEKEGLPLVVFAQNILRSYIPYTSVMSFIYNNRFSITTFLFSGLPSK